MPHLVRPLEFIAPILASMSFFLLIAVGAPGNLLNRSKLLNNTFFVASVLTGLAYCWLAMLGLGPVSPFLAAIWLVVPVFLKVRRVI